MCGMVGVDAAERLVPWPGGSGAEGLPRTAGSRIAVSNLELWRGEYCVCRDLTLSVTDGQLLHLRGANGAGKTSLLRVLAGLALADSGEIRFDGSPVTRNPNRWRGSLCYVGHSDGIKRELTPRENLRLASRLLAHASDEDIDVVLKRVGIANHADRLCAELSAGQRRRTALARLLVSRARIWLLDEPLVSLDAAGGQLLEQLLREQLNRGGIAAVATHQPIDFSGLDVVYVDLPQRDARC